MSKFIYKKLKIRVWVVYGPIYFLYRYGSFCKLYDLRQTAYVDFDTQIQAYNAQYIIGWGLTSCNKQCLK